MALVPVKINGRILKPHKALVAPNLTSRTVLTNSHWEFVELWLKREKKTKALFYWNQAKEFSYASQGLPTPSAPLLHYYSFMNAAKALLSAKGLPFTEYHGVKAHNSGSSRKISLTNEGVLIMNAGILPSLLQYFSETETTRTHTLQEVFFNLVYIHRTYCLTYSSQRDLFIPLVNCRYVFDTSHKVTFFLAELSADFSSNAIAKHLPSGFAVASNDGGLYTIRSTATANISSASRITAADLSNLQQLHTTVRQDLFYVNGSQTLWYIKINTKGPKILRRYSPTLTLAAMHRLSELCRYKPFELSSFLSGQKNWLLSEFIQQAPLQYLDEISSEITGHQFLSPNVRPAT